MMKIKAILASGATVIAAAAATAVLPVTAASAASPPQCNTVSVVENMDMPTFNGSVNCELGTFSGNTHQLPVKSLQGAMNVCFGKSVLGSVYPLSVDGDFGSNTLTALERVQSFINVDSDGEYGPITRMHFRWENDNDGIPCVPDGGV